MTLGIVHVGHKCPDVWVRSILSLLLSIDDFEGKQYYVGFNSADADTLNRVERVVTIIDEAFPGFVTSRIFTNHPGLMGYPASNWEIMHEHEHEHWLQVGSDVFAVTRHIDRVLLGQYLAFRRSAGIAYTGPVININQICAPYFLSRCMPDSQWGKEQPTLQTMKPTQGVMWTVESQLGVWQETDSLLKQADQLCSEAFPCILPFEYSCGMVLFHKDIVREVGRRWLTQGEERALHEVYKGKGFLMNGCAYAAHFCYHPAFSAMFESGVYQHVYALVDRVIVKRAVESANREKWQDILTLVNSVIETPINVNEAGYEHDLHRCS